MIKRMMPWMIMVLTSITLITLAAFLLWHFVFEEKLASVYTTSSKSEVQVQRLSAKEKQELTVNIDDYMTNLANMNYFARLSFSFLLEDKKTREEMELLIPTVKSILNRTLADTEPTDMLGSAGLDQLNQKLMEEINDILSVGELRSIEITERLITTQ